MGNYCIAAGGRRKKVLDKFFSVEASRGEGSGGEKGRFLSRGKKNKPLLSAKKIPTFMLVLSNQVLIQKDCRIILNHRVSHFP